MRKIFRRGLLATLLIAASLPALGQSDLDFRVFLDQKEIGTHRFDLVDRDGERELIERGAHGGQAAVRHRVHLRSSRRRTLEWRLRDASCRRPPMTMATSIASMCSVGTARRSCRRSKARSVWASACSTFAYWNPAMLQQTELLNSQDGEHVKVKITDAGADAIVVRGVKTPARRYELRSEKLSIDLWYSEQQEWLALESKTERGQKLIYKLK